MITKKIIIPLIIVIILAGIGGVLTAKKTTENRLTNTADATINTEPRAQPSEDVTVKEQLKSGRYESYSTEKFSESGYSQTVLFFYAAWCPECRAFKQAINSSDIPEGTQVLEVNYDNSNYLKKLHGVTLQSTFVKVDVSGNQVSKWVGYGKDKSLETVLGNL